MDTYFGVTPGEAGRSQYTSFSPEGGLVSLGFELNARYDFRNGWGLHGTLAWSNYRTTPAGRQSRRRAAATSSRRG
jgi:outer membrane scaffolding protein for murein synthesis (MipA/OmpV family)